MVNVIGLGYIGLPTALMLAASGVPVIGTDCNEVLVETLQQGKTTFHEEGLEDLFASAVSGGIRFTTQYIQAQVYILAVPTPYDRDSRKVDAGYIEKAMQAVMSVCPQDAIVIIESTVSPGTIDRSVRPILAASGKQVHLAHAPERIIPGNMLRELTCNSRTIGTDTPEIGQQVAAIYRSFCKGEIVLTDIRTAEMTKVVENTFRDINIAYANELAKICRSGGLDVYEVIRIANKHPRVSILQPGPGVGGHCISVDPWFLVGDYPGLANIILAARRINDSMPEYVLERVHDIMQAQGMQDVSRVGFYGITYKENVDDIRQSPALQIMDTMARHLSAGSVQLYDPYVNADLFPNQHHDLDTFLAHCDLVVLLVGHAEIRQNMHLLKGKVILDTRNICPFPEAYKL